MPRLTQQQAGTVDVYDVRDTDQVNTGSLRNAASPEAVGGKSAAGRSRAQQIAKREHPIHKTRADRLNINTLALEGGEPYIEARLSRFPGETRISWDGGQRLDGSAVTGRKAQAHCIPYGARIAEKISQYVFAEAAKREGVDEDVESNITRDGTSISQFMRRVNNALTACGWCWVLVDMPQGETDAGSSALAKEQEVIRPYWTLFEPLKVVDWKFGPTGMLQWLITEDEAYDPGTPYSEGKTAKVRDLWEPGLRTRFTYDSKSGGATITSHPFALNKVPFILFGEISSKPHLFDSIESINRTIMDLESCSRQNYFDRCFPQMYLPANAVASAATALNCPQERVMEMIVGLGYPILLEAGDPNPGYIQPNMGDLANIDRKVDQLKEAMFECVGLMLRQESRAAQSGEAKAWDHLDANAVLCDRANLLEESEQKLVDLSVEWDAAGFPYYEPEYPKSFDVSDFQADIQSVVNASALQMPVELLRVLQAKLLELVDQIGSSRLTDEEKEAILEAIKNFKEAAMTSPWDVGTDQQTMLSLDEQAELDDLLAKQEAGTLTADEAARVAELQSKRGEGGGGAVPPQLKPFVPRAEGGAA